MGASEDGDVSMDQDGVDDEAKPKEKRNGELAEYDLDNYDDEETEMGGKWFALSCPFEFTVELTCRSWTVQQSKRALLLP